MTTRDESASLAPTATVGAAAGRVEAAPGAAPALRLRLAVCYDGTDFSGWAVQPGRRTVAGEIGRALEILFRTPIPMVVAGRTDAGVHATGQVAHLDVPPEGLAALTPRHLAAGGPRGPAPTPDAGLTGLRRRLAGLLPADVRVPAITLAAPGFDARFAALRRHYRYRIVTSDWGAAPDEARFVLHWRRSLNAAAMAEAAAGLVGLHDFAAFCKPREGATTIRQLQALDVTSQPAMLGGGDEVTIDVAADAFCHSMVRSLVGALIAVGEGRHASSRPAALLAQRRRTAEIAVAPARGLTLVAVDYPPDAELAARGAQTRAVREDPCGCDGPEG